MKDWQQLLRTYWVPICLFGPVVLVVIYWVWRAYLGYLTG